MGASARRGSWSGVPWSHPHFVLEFSLISVVPVCWGNERKKERKNTEKEMGSERKWRKERKKKKSSETERRNIYHWRPSSTLAETRLSETRNKFSYTTISEK